MSECKPVYYSGLGDCQKLFERIVGFLKIDKKTAISDEKLIATWTAIMAGASSQTGIYIPISNGYQNNTAEPTFTASNTGNNRKEDDPNVNLLGFFSGSYCDYKTFFPADDSLIDFVAVLDDGSLWLTKSKAGASEGFRARFNIRKNAPQADSKLENFPIYINFEYSDELDRGFVSTPSFSLKQLRDIVPVGLAMEVTTAWAANAVTVKITERCSPNAPYQDIADENDFEVLSAEADAGAAISSVDITNAAQGIYVLTTSVLTDNIVIRAIGVDTNLEYVSQPTDIVV